MAENKESESLEFIYNMEEEGQNLEEEEPSKPSGKLRWLAEAVSVLLHPLFVPSIIFGVVLYFSPLVSAPLSEDYRLQVWGLLVLSTLVIPLFSFLILHFFGSMPSLKMEQRTERPAPFVYISIFYIVTTYFFVTKYPSLININIILAGISLILVLLTLITFYWKISAHSTSIGGAVGFLASFTLLYHDLQLLYPLSIMVVVAGVCMSARLYLNEHKPLEVWVGAMLGFTVSFASVFTIFLL